MDPILIFFVFPLVTIILSAVLEFLVRCPVAVAAVAFSVWVLIAFLVFDTTTFFIAVFVYTLLAFLTSIIVKFIRCNLRCKSCENCECFKIGNIVTAGIEDTITDAVNDAVNAVVPEAVNEAINNLVNNNSCGCGCNNNLANNSNNNSGCGCSRTYFRR